MIRIRPFLSAAASAALVALVGATPAVAVDELNVTSGLTADGAPLAVHGYDPVAYFTEGAPAAGSAEHATVHDGATYYFASKANRKAFEADPTRYVPAFGGFCAYGVSVGKKFDGNPRYWTVSDGRLYLNLNEEIAEAFNEDVAGAIAKAEREWREIEHEAVADL